MDCLHPDVQVNVIEIVCYDGDFDVDRRTLTIHNDMSDYVDTRIESVTCVNCGADLNWNDWNKEDWQ